MSRHSRDKLLFSVFALGSLVALMFAVAELGHRQRAAGAVTVEEVTPTRTPQPRVPAIELSPTPTASPAPSRAPQPCQIPGYPLWFCGPGGKLELPWYENFDATDEHCVRKMLALVSREGSPFATFKQYRDDRWWAAWRACPEFRR